MPSTNANPLITLDNITVRIRDRHILANTCWKIHADQNWAVLGPNGSGKSSLARVLCGDLDYVQGRLIRHTPDVAAEKIGYVSFEFQERLLAREQNRDAARDFSGRWDTYITARDIIQNQIHTQSGVDAGSNVKRIADLMGISPLLDRGIRFLSNGEMCKVILARALVKKPGLLILDEPFEGLDAVSKKRLQQIIQTLIQDGARIILITHRLDEIPPAISHVICLKDLRVFCQGERRAILTSQRINALHGPPQNPPGAGYAMLRNNRQPPAQAATIIRMKQVTVAYNGVKVLDRFDWTVKQGQNWAVTGPNGSGKTTLLSLIAGDHLQAYANDIYLFGQKRGGGETIWALKSKIGVVSPELQTRYRRNIRGYDVVLSGFFDSVGLFRRANAKQHQDASAMIKFLDIEKMASSPFNQLSYGQKRMILLARAMVKAPQLLILDEPCQGLDLANRRIILDQIDQIGTLTDTQFLYVTHYEDEMPASVNHHLRIKGPIEPPV